MPQHHHCRQDQRGRVRLVLTGNVGSRAVHLTPEPRASEMRVHQAQFDAPRDWCASRHTDSNTAASVPMFPLGVRPKPPMRPAHRSLTISPYRLGITCPLTSRAIHQITQGSRSASNSDNAVRQVTMQRCETTTTHITHMKYHQIHHFGILHQLETDIVQGLLIVLNLRILLRHLAATFQEQTIAQFLYNTA